jgi:hypothetical protein
MKSLEWLNEINGIDSRIWRNGGVCLTKKKQLTVVFIACMREKA